LVIDSIGHSIEDRLYKAKWGMKEHIDLLVKQKLPIPIKNPDPKIIVQADGLLTKWKTLRTQL
jgi:hypothetical protein